MFDFRAPSLADKLQMLKHLYPTFKLSTITKTTKYRLPFTFIGVF